MVTNSSTLQNGGERLLSNSRKPSRDVAPAFARGRVPALAAVVLSPDPSNANAQRPSLTATLCVLPERCAVCVHRGLVRRDRMHDAAVSAHVPRVRRHHRNGAQPPARAAPRPHSHSIGPPPSQFDLKNRRTFLKRCDYPSVKLSDLYKGGIVSVYSRQLTVVEYGDGFTARAFEKKTEMCAHPHIIVVKRIPCRATPLQGSSGCF